MLKKLYSSIKSSFQIPQTKKIQEKINSLKRINDEKTAKELCKLLREYSKLSVSVPVDVRNSFLQNAHFENICLKRVCFWNSNLTNSIFTKAQLPDADFWQANLNKANFSNAVLTNSIFSHTNLTHTNFSGAILKNARFDEAVLEGADFSDANLKWAKVELQQFKKVKSLKNTIMPDGTIFSEEWKNAIYNV